MAKVRVYELAREFGVESKAVMDQLKEMGEFVRSASSTIEAPVVRRLKEAFSAKAAEQSKPRPSASHAPRDGAGAAQAGSPAGVRPGGGPRPEAGVGTASRAVRDHHAGRHQVHPGHDGQAGARDVRQRIAALDVPTWLNRQKKIL